METILKQFYTFDDYTKRCPERAHTVSSPMFNSRHLKNFDFENLTQKACRGGAWKARVPTIRGKVRVSMLIDCL